MSDTNLAIFRNLTEDEQTRLLANLAQSKNGNGPAHDSRDTYVPRPISLADHLKRDFPPLHWLVDGMIATGHLVMLGGRPKSGKSWLVLQLAQAVDRGHQFLDRQTKRGRVLYVALEDGERRVYQRCKILNWQPESADVMFDIARFDAEGMTGPGVDEIARLAGNYDFIIIDTLIATLSGRANENDNPAMAAIMNELARIAHGSDTAILLVHHTGKGSAENIFDLLRGASSLRGAYDVGMLLERKQDEREALLHMESRDVDLMDMTIRQANGGAGWDALGNGLEIHKIRAGRRVVEVLVEHGDGLTTKELAELAGKSEQTIRKQLKNAEADGWVRREQQKDGSTKPADIWYIVQQEAMPF